MPSLKMIFFRGQKYFLIDVTLHGFLLPPQRYGGGIKFDPNYLGGTLDIFPNIGGTVDDGGGTVMMGQRPNSVFEYK